MKYFLLAGEASGDMHGAGLMREIKQYDPQAEFWFLGGDAMAAEGGRMIRHFREMAFMGFWQVARNAGKISKNFSVTKRALLEFQPDTVILIDYPGFNMKISGFVVRELKIPVYYYIVPKVWAWKTYRIKQLKREMRALLTIFPFETEFFARYGATVEYVGNPSVDAINAYLQTDQVAEKEFRSEMHLGESPYLVLLPGSRKQEIRSCLPEMLKAASKFENYKLLIAGAPGVETEFYADLLPQLPVPVVTGQTFRMVRYAAAAVVNSGTATLETALLHTPQVVVYSVKGGKFAYWLKNTFLKTPYISLVNILMQREVVTELVAHLMTAGHIEAELRKILFQPLLRQQMLSSYAELEQQLGAPGTARRAAGYICSDLKTSCPEGLKNTKSYDNKQ